MVEPTLSEDTYFFNVSIDLLAVIDLKGSFQRVNPAFTRVLGYSEAELLGASVFSFIHPDDHRATVAEMDQVTAGTPTLFFENRYRTKQGDYRWLTWTASPQLDRGVIYCIARDVTLQKQAEATLRESEERWQLALQTANATLEQRVAERTAELEQVNRRLHESEVRFRTALNYIPDVFVIYDAQRQIQFINTAALTLTGRPIADFLGRTDEEIHPPMVTDAYLPLLQRAVATKSYQTGECTIALPSQAPYTIVVQYVPLLDDQGEIHQILGITHDITDRKRAEETLRQREQYVRRLLDSLFSFVGVMTPDGVLIEANRTALDAADLKPEDVLGKPFEETFWWSYSTEVQATLRVAIARARMGETVRYDAVVRVRDDQLITIDFTLGPIFDAAGEIEYLIPSGIDISDRKRAEVALQESQQQIQRQLAEIETIYQSAPIGLGVIHADLRFVRINQRLAEINGFSIEEHLGRTVGDLLPDLADTAEALLRSIFATGEPLLNVEVRGETPAQPGVERVWLESFWPLKDGDRVVGVNTVCEEITERKQIEAALRQSEERYRTLFETMADGFCVIQMIFDVDDNPLDYRFLEVNPAFEQQTGLRQATGKTARQLIPDLEDDWFVIYGQVALTGEPTRFEHGSEAMNHWFEVSAFAIGDAAEHKVALLFQEISDRKAMEAQRERLLQQEHAAREAAEQANRVKDEFLAILSHELRTPLNPIVGWSKLLQAPEVSPEKLRQGLSTIERNAKQQAQLIEDLLDISRIIHGQLALKLAPVNLATPIGSALETVRLAAEAKTIDLAVDLDPAVGPIRGDIVRLQQVVWNLLTNAVKFTPQGGRVAVRLSQVDRYAQLQVSDTGQGITPGFLPQVFEVFKQQDSSITRSFGGLGLGLAIARQVTEAHGGTISATSAGDGQGSTFTVQLPLMPVPASPPPGAPPSPAVQVPHLRVLVVDDEIDSLTIVEMILVQAGAIVKTVPSAAQALQLLTETPFDLLISDIGMPGMDGYSLIRQVRSLSTNGNIPAIALTAYAGEANQIRVLAAGFQAHMAKPIDPPGLLAQVIAIAIP